MDSDQSHIQRFKERVRERALPENIIQLSTELTGDGKLATSHLDQLCQELSDLLKKWVQKEAVRLKEEEVESEKGAQSRHLSKLTQNFIGREEEKAQILKYMESEGESQPLILYGPSGMGKSSLLGEVIREWERRGNGPRLIYRFCGITEGSSSTKAIWASIFRELGMEPPFEERQMGKRALSVAGKAEEEDWEGRIAQAIALNIKEPLVIVIDALDQLEDRSQCQWLPEHLPKHIKMVISVLNDEKYSEDSYYYQKLRERLDNFYELPPLKDKEAAREILETSLWPSKP